MDIDSPPAPPSGATPLPLPQFSAAFPLPFRVLFLVGLAILLWATNLHVLHLLGLDTSWVLDIRDGDDAVMSSNYDAYDGDDDIDMDERDRDTLSPSGTNSHGRSHSPRIIDLSAPGVGPTGPLRPPSSKLYGPVYRVFALYTAWCLGGWVVFRLLAGDDTDAMESWRGLVGLIALGPLLAAVLPFRGLVHRERRAFRSAMKRILMPPANAPIYFCDVILADILTSFAKVLGDLYVSLQQILFGGITQGRATPHGVSKWITLAMVSLPYLLRFRQCMIEFYHSGWKSMRPLANAFKYASAFPVIFLSAAQKYVVKDIAEQKGISPAELASTSGRWFGEHPLFRMWLLAVVVNSMFSFYWDVEKDWGLSLCELETWFPFSGSNGPRESYLTSRGRDAPRTLWARLRRSLGRSDRDIHNRSPNTIPHDLNPPTSPLALTGSTKLFGLRQTLLLPDPSVYYMFTIIDLVLRFTWSLDLSSHLHTISKIESGVFMMEALELVRRWMWVFIRVEWEAVRMGEMSRFRRGRERTAVLWADKSGNEDD